MRVTSEFFVSSLVRRVFAEGGFAAVERRGAEAAGAIFVVQRGRDGSLRLYGPAVQTLAGEDGRRFMLEAASDEEAMRTRFEREARFDPDFWVVELEVEDPAAYLDLAEED
ncbi:DUF1491 family protein [Aureimonas mangrovi]|uniref:DUF1491 family protein n=1 Tax=Aureimonas mangrovi TaxID=2758041 RepID=UPI00163D5EEF|nr:DUF1491 family protein [Aureimonas mangrovi]